MHPTDDSKSKRISEENTRRNPRARISLPIRVRCADFAADQVDEVRATINVSRGGLYFSSQRSSYHRGMNVLLTIPFRGFVADAGPEEGGEVVRVEHFKGGGREWRSVSWNPRKAGLHMKCIRLELNKRGKVQFPSIA
jgi:hypothetical protein